MPALFDKAFGRRGQPGLRPQDVVDALPVGVARFDAGSRLALCNGRFAELLGLPPERLDAGMPFGELVDACRSRQAPGTRENTGLLMMDGTIPTQPRRVERAMPQGRRIELHAAALPDGGMLLTALDMTAPRALAAAPQAPQATRAPAAANEPDPQQDPAGQVQALRREFIAGMSHDLRTPLNAIMGMLQLAQATLLTPVQAGYVARAQEAAQQLLVLAGDRLDALELEPAGDGPPAPTHAAAAALAGLPLALALEPAPGLEGEPQAAPVLAPLSALGPRPLAGMRILLAEDNETNQVVARELLTGQGARVEIAVDGLDTLAALVAGGEFDAILMDWQMPNMDGLEATREIRLLVGSQHMPIIALTANATPADRAACLAAGMNAHLAKPVDVEALVHTLLRHAPRSTAALRAAREAQAQATPALAQPPLQPVDLPAAEAFPPIELALQAAPAEPASPWIDRDAALARLGGNVALYEQVASLFRREAPALLREMDEASRGGQRPHVRRLAHTLKGTAGNLGATALAAAAAQAENCFHGQPGDGDAPALEALRGAVEQALSGLTVQWDLR